jgi:F-box protein, helicase, 18
MSNANAEPKPRTDASARPKPHWEWATPAPRLNLTQEQQEIVAFHLEIGESLVVEAGAGTGKTTCFIEFSKARPSTRLLYVCFNNKAAAEAHAKYEKEGVGNTKTSTIHGLAWKEKAYFEKHGKFRTKVSVRDIEGVLRRCGGRPALAPWVLDTIKSFTESAERSIEAVHLPSIVGADRGEPIVQDARLVWTKMLDPKDPCPVSYDHYLKVFQLQGSKLNYDYILLDEAQDCNPLTLSLLQSQSDHTRIILIGDESQGIYAWRGARNAMKEWESPNRLTLTESFRFGPNIATLANFLLECFQGRKGRIRGRNPSDRLGSLPSREGRTVIARTNATLFERAVKIIDMGGSCHFVGTNAQTGWDPTVPYRLDDAKDAYRLWNGDKTNIRNPHIKSFVDFPELKKAAEGNTQDTKSKPQQGTQPEPTMGDGGEVAEGPESPSLPGSSKGDKELMALCRLVEKYKHRLPELISKIATQCTGPNGEHPKGKKAGPVTILTTAHRAKGLEWDNVEIADDFSALIHREKGERPRLMAGKESEQGKPLGLKKGEVPVEEFNLLYVAATRAKKSLEVNKELKKLLLREDLRELVPEGATPKIPKLEFGPRMPAKEDWESPMLT